MYTRLMYMYNAWQVQLGILSLSRRLWALTGPKMDYSTITVLRSRLESPEPIRRHNEPHSDNDPSS